MTPIRSRTHSLIPRPPSLPSRVLAPLAAACMVLATGCGGDSSASSGGVGVNTAEPGVTGLSQAGAQDFGLFRQILEAGLLPGPETIDDLGFFAEHKIEQPAADCGENLCVHGVLGAMGNMMNGAACTLVQVALSTPLDPATLARPPLHLVLAVDVSGSMQGEAIDYVREGLARMLDALQPVDRVSLVTYSDEARVVLRDVSAADGPTLRQAFSSLRAGGSTNLFDGLFTALTVADDLRDPEWQNRVVLLSDGLATVGITDPERTASLAADYARLGIGTTTIGLGEQFDVEVMRRVAEVGAGSFYFLEDPAAAREVFVDEVKTSLWPVATDVRIKLEVGAGYRLGRVYGTNGFVYGAGGGVIEIPALFIAGRQTVDEPIDGGRRGGGGAILVELLPVASAEGVPDPYRVSRLSTSWLDPASGEIRNDTVVVDSPDLPGVVRPEGLFDTPGIEKGFVMLNLYVGLRLAAEAALEGDLTSARAVLTALRPSVAEWLIDHPDLDIADDLTWVDRFIENLDVAQQSLGFELPPAEVVPDPWPAD